MAPPPRLQRLSPAIFVVHSVDEYLAGFPQWATRHFGTTSERFYVASHGVLITPVVLLTRTRHERARPVVLGAIAAAFVANALFHVETTLRFGEPSPGLRTAVTLMAPGGVLLLRDLIATAGLDTRRLLIACGVGAAVNAAAVASLRVDMPTLRA